MSQTAPNVSALFSAAAADGSLSQKSLQALNLVDPGAQIQQGLGVNVGDIEASEVILVTLLIDDSGSIRFVAGNADLVRQGHNGVRDALKDAKQAAALLMSTRYLNGTILYAYCQLQDTVEMTPQNFDPNGGTPLNDQAIVTLGQVLAKAQEFADNGVPVRTVTAIITDGKDESSRASASQVKALVDDLLRQENHIVCAMGISDGHTDFKAVFTEMGIRPEWILTPGNTPKEIRAAFKTISQSAVRVSQAANFSKAKLGGFGG